MFSPVGKSSLPSLAVLGSVLLLFTGLQAQSPYHYDPLLESLNRHPLPA